MYLIYTDESGISFNKRDDDNFRDGPFSIYGGLTIDIYKYEEIEGSFKDLCNSILKVKNVLDREIHAGNLFYKKEEFADLSDESLFIFEVLYAEEFGLKVSERKLKFVKRNERTVAHFFYSCVEMASLTGDEGIYDSLFNVIRGNAFILNNPFGVIKNCLAGISNYQSR